jgi:hypothetical protein
MSAIGTLRYFAPLLLLFPDMAISQGNQPHPLMPAGCPVELTDFHPSSTLVVSSGLGVRVKNVSGKEIDGLVFDAALADAAENWQWLHWDFDQTRPLRDFGWNKPIKSNESKKLSWDLADLDFRHGGGGAFVLTSALFGDGSDWHAPSNTAECKIVWYNSNKKSLIKPVDLPLRQ